MVTTTLIWAVGIIAFVILEAFTYQLVSIWFAAGAAGGMVASALGANFTVQMITAFAIAAIFLLCLRPVSMKLLKSAGAKTNVDRIIGKEAIVTQKIDNIRSEGAVKVDTMTWSARSSDNSVIAENTEVVIEKIEGVKLIVSRKE